TNPMLGLLRNNGGLTKTIALHKGSKAIDWVALSSCPATDQRGQPRPDGNGESTCDIGAYESAH
ncbi:MAG: choice-of-anchor Q domain-containing protein, partial [Ktedonobacteraceae bacterium]